MSLSKTIKFNSFKILLNDTRNLSDKKLFTPGPLLTSMSVKKAMLRDLGSRDSEFIQVIQKIQNKLLDLAGLSGNNNYVSVLMQGSGTFGVESVIQTLNTRNKANFLVLENGAYGQRMANICKRLNISVQMESFPEDDQVHLDRVEEILKKGKNYSHIGVIHSETTSGVLNNVESIGKLVKNYLPESTFVVDSISSFGAVPISIKDSRIDFLVGSSNKCIQSVPGFAFVICSKDKLLACKDNSISLSLDLYDQYVSMSKTNQFRFTPPIQSLLAFQQALVELDEEGGPSARYKRYSSNHAILRNSLIKMGFKELVPVDKQSKIINTFFYPNDKNFNFEEFYNRLSKLDKIIYPGKITRAPCFRIGNIGDLHEKDMHDLIDAIKRVLNDMNIKVPFD